MRRLIVLGSMVLIAISALTWNRSVPVDEGPMLMRLAPGASGIKKTGAPPLYRLPDGAVAFNTFDIVPRLKGYGGPIKTMVVLGSDGRIRGLGVLDHHETLNYVHLMFTREYLDRFIGKHVGDPFIAGRDVDAITRATVSVEAFTRAVAESSRAVAAGEYGIVVSDGGARARSAMYVPAAVCAALVIAGYVMYRVTRKNKRLLWTRHLTMAGGVIVMGLWLATMFSAIHVFNIALGRGSLDPLWLAVAGGVLVSVALAGRQYCGWLCPFGAVSEWIALAPVRKWEIGDRDDARWRGIKYALLLLMAVSVAATGNQDSGNYEVYLALFTFNAAWPLWALTALALASNVFIGRFWCRYLCPVAALTGAASRDASGYPGGSGCPMGNRRNSGTSECVRCNRCFSEGDN